MEVIDADGHIVEKKRILGPTSRSRIVNVAARFCLQTDKTV
jgi:hypothetical protein